MAIDYKQLRDFVKKSSGKEILISYAELNNQYDKGTPTDIRNEIYNDIVKLEESSIEKFLKAIFEPKDLEIVYHKDEGEWLVKKGHFVSKVEITNNQSKGLIYVEANLRGGKFKLIVETPQGFLDQKSKEYLKKMIDDCRKVDDLSKVLDVISNMMKK